MANELKRTVLDGKAPKRKVGDEVTWRARPYDPLDHKGFIVAILEPGESSRPHICRVEEAEGRLYAKGRDTTGNVSTRQRYLVKVPRTGARGLLAPFWYSPLVSVIDREAS